MQVFDYMDEVGSDNEAKRPRVFEVGKAKGKNKRDYYITVNDRFNVRKFNKKSI